MKSYLTIEGEYSHKIEVKHSVFICSIKGIDDFEEGMEFVKEISKKYSDATHNCYALKTIDNRQKFYDANEPGGTAGQPILQALNNNDLNNVAAVVTRYFGGVKLGAAGLKTAYSKSVLETLEKSRIVKKALCKEGIVVLEYSYLGDMLNFLNRNAQVIDTLYGQNAEIRFAGQLEDIDQIDTFVANLTSGKTQIKWINTNYYTIKPKGEIS
ncbi:MAG: YigZ family protein [Bacillota bacterium]|jgi:uncharacterized YigZ family protein|nr:YigZ family protein [Bacillota bacterium]HHU43399.1 YigZ family protein [Clostridiales bacterium]